MCEPVPDQDSRKQDYPNSGYCCKCNKWKKDVNEPCRWGHSHKGHKVVVVEAPSLLIDLEKNG